MTPAHWRCSTTQTFVKSLGSQTVRHLLSRTTFDLAGWLRGDKLDLFLIFPPDKLESHRALLRLLVGTLLVVLMRRTRIPAERTLLLIDEAAQLGKLAHLKTALDAAGATPLRRGYAECSMRWMHEERYPRFSLARKLAWTTLMPTTTVSDFLRIREKNRSVPA